MDVIAVIPARLAASRFPNKPLEKILGMPMIGHCYYRTCLAVGVQNTYVATCDNEIADYIKSIGGSVVMTSDTHTRATTRTAEAVDIIEKRVGEKVDVVIMVQGDEPVISPDAIAEVTPHFNDENIDIVNIMSRLKTLDSFIDKNNVKVVVNNQNNALYFSREAIPSPWHGWDSKNTPSYMQTGIIAFRRDKLEQFNAMQETSLEQIESVDMNRVLQTGGNIRMILTDTETLGVDTQEEMIMAEEILTGDPFVEKYLGL